MSRGEAACRHLTFRGRQISLSNLRSCGPQGKMRKPLLLCLPYVAPEVDIVTGRGWQSRVSKASVFWLKDQKGEVQRTGKHQEIPGRKELSKVTLQINV